MPRVGDSRMILTQEGIPLLLYRGLFSGFGSLSDFVLGAFQTVPWGLTPPELVRRQQAQKPDAIIATTDVSSGRCRLP